ncbi:diacylglycerol kinase family lipid kinase [Phocaeicola barnesiae]|jgi:diacylglycerol kinase (ATP)|uniref:Diacylglycerol kinase family lipid kinase n=1 Tax=Phocaeicola barnesiae TaxID=376804 RepID=A0AAW5N8Q3_9BACT|nr:diacylglycerol kinase family protein [Phocaeicola barnesiae]CDD34040.1 lipid kinase YegS/Rv2252/BmrU family [Bacteroides sp. CAG:714]MCF2576437.1 diacylglycerol kinase family lipid kinase [Phocaeicola barnesiae]MCF2597752.1 diacylglycerol kinase family lipid kinase [Phocaeicola barnesiae]MCR8873684.1 diacylglycerol kinase family lipid kinase [Phocaeicola barnesiae]MDM8232510.1 diacylglycerol kinase family lipid kinase [Phocaeicola barnesiae]
MNSRQHITFIVNPISGTHNKHIILQLVDELIDKERYSYIVRGTEYAGHASLLAEEAVRQHADIVVAIGGDGTINEVGRSLVHTNTSMGIIPCGSGNGLARHLHIPLDPKKAIDILNKGFVKKIDYGIIDSHPFFCTCGVGFDAFVSLKFADSGKRGLATYLENTLRESLTYKPETYTIENSSGTVSYKAFLIACANASQYGNNAYIAPQASLTDGMMDVTILEPFTVLDVPALSFQLFNKTIDQNSRIKTMKDKSIVIHRESEGVFHFDGDPIMGGKDLKVEIIQGGLNVVAPENPRNTMEPFSLLQHFTDFVGQRPISSLIAARHKQFLQLNQNLLRQLSNKKKN